MLKLRYTAKMGVVAKLVCSWIDQELSQESIAKLLRSWHAGTLPPGALQWDNRTVAMFSVAAYVATPTANSWGQYLDEDEAIEYLGDVTMTLFHGINTKSDIPDNLLTRMPKACEHIFGIKTNRATA